MVAHVIAETERQHGWRVLYKEHSWNNPDDDASGFVDLVLRSRDDGCALVVECKRAQEAQWAFLIDDEKHLSRRHAKAWINHFAGGGFAHKGWADIGRAPVSPQSLFCVVPGQGQAKPMLERIGAELVSATEAVAEEDSAIQARVGTEWLFCLSAVVTNAKLCVCLVEPGKISLADGKFALADAKVFEVSYVRFIKQLTKRRGYANIAADHPWLALEMARERTVLVVNAEHLVQFLVDFKVDGWSVEQALRL